MTYDQISREIRRARERGLSIEVLAIPLEAQLALSVEASGRAARLTKINGIPVIEAQLLAPQASTPANLKLVN